MASSHIFFLGARDQPLLFGVHACTFRPHSSLFATFLFSHARLHIPSHLSAMKWPQSSFRGAKARISLFLVALLSLSLTFPSVVNAAHQKVLLRDVQTLTVHKGRMTTGRRSSPVPQVNCVGGNACGDFEPGKLFFLSKRKRSYGSDRLDPEAHVHQCMTFLFLFRSSFF